MQSELERLRDALIDRFHLERELGHGGMATVYLARDFKHNRQVAIKVLRPELAAVVGRERFRKEIEIAARLRHPQIVPVFDSGEADDSLYYVMPFVQGESLRQALQREKQLTLDDALRITREIADALAYAHSHDVVHRDIKPENILLESGHAVVADFGIARAVSAAAGEKLTETGLVVGTPTYMSPEQTSGDGVVDGRSDQYSLACVLYEMLAGDPPFMGSSAQAIWARKAGGEVPSLRSVRRAVPVPVDRALQRALCTAPADRFPSIHAFASALSEPVPATRRRIMLAAVATLVVVGLTAAALWKVNGADDPQRVERLAVLPFANLTGDQAQQHFVDAMHEALITELWQIGALTVRPRQSVLQFRETQKTISQIADELGVDAIVQASVFRIGDSVRVTAQLLQARPAERHLWTHTFQEPLSGVLELQSDVARAIAERLQVALSPAEVRRLERVQRVNPVAHDAWARGWRELTKGNAPAMERCVSYAYQAASIDSGFARAYALAARCHLTLAFVSPTPPHKAFLRAREEAQRAITIDPSLGEAHAWLAGALSMRDWNWSAADRAYVEAIRLTPSDANVRWAVGFFQSWMGRHEEALSNARRAEQIDPLHPMVSANVAMALYLARRYDEAIAQAKLAIGLNPEFGFAYDRLAHAFEGKMMYDEAVAAWEQAVARQPGDIRRKAYLGRAYALAARRDDAMRILNDLRRMPSGTYVPPTSIAMIHLGLGDHEEAVTWIERGFKERDGEMVLLKTWPVLDPLRSNQRFQRVLSEMKFPE